MHTLSYLAPALHEYARFNVAQLHLSPNFSASQLRKWSMYVTIALRWGTKIVSARS